MNDTLGEVQDTNFVFFQNSIFFKLEFFEYLKNYMDNAGHFS